jgi:three-Cys-motif partner protein
MVDDVFFEESQEQSQIKSRIVAKYFWAWARVIIPTAKTHGERIAYIDLFAGPGRYLDGTLSTPILVLEKAIADENMRRMLVTIFNDKNAESASSLNTLINSLPEIEQLAHKPQVRNEEIGTQIVKMFEPMRLVPTFFFVDPWGYKGLSLALINSVLKNWGCDCIFFFNYNRINMGLNNPTVREHMNVLFGEARANRIREKSNGLSPEEREALIIEELSQALKEMGANYVLPFSFKNEQGTRTKHYLIFATKDFKGYEIMKDIMAGESSEQEQGVPTFEYSPAAERFPLLFELSRPLDDLEDMLLSDFAGQRLSMQAVYQQHSVGRRYIKKNYKKALTNLEAARKISTEPPVDKRSKRDGVATFGDNVVIRFPKREQA